MSAKRSGWSLLLVFVLLFVGCASGPKVQTFVDSPPLGPAESFGIIDATDSSYAAEPGVIFVGKIRVGDNSFGGRCDYQAALERGAQAARQLGANLLVVTKHELPGALSSCHRIEADLFSIKDAYQYEDEIVWHEDRKLQLQNFRGDTINRPFQAATASTIRFEYSGSPVIGKFYVTPRAVFSTKLSYLKEDDDLTFVLSHEQLHFDITELFARKFAALVRQEAFPRKSVTDDLQKRIDKLTVEWAAYQDKYDSEVYADSALQTKWDDQVARELAALSDYVDKKVQISFERPR